MITFCQERVIARMQKQDLMSIFNIGPQILWHKLGHALFKLGICIGCVDAVALGADHQDPLHSVTLLILFSIFLVYMFQAILLLKLSQIPVIPDQHDLVKRTCFYVLKPCYLFTVTDRGADHGLFFFRIILIGRFFSCFPRG